jgi:hypothetical protein
MTHESSRDRAARKVPAMGEFTPHANDTPAPVSSVTVTPLLIWMSRHIERANGDIHLAILYMQTDLRKRGTR